jgi:hypothetical protein
MFIFAAFLLCSARRGVGTRKTKGQPEEEGFCFELAVEISQKIVSPCGGDRFLLRDLSGFESL